MKIEKAKHTLAKLRLTLGLKQQTMAALLDVSVAAIQSIETRRLDLSKKLAQRAWHETGVDPDWLLANDVSKPVKFWPSPEPFTDAQQKIAVQSMVELFKERQERGNTDRVHLGDAQLFWWDVTRLIAISASAVARRKNRLLGFKINQVLEEWISEFGFDEKLFAALNHAIGSVIGGPRAEPLDSPKFKRVQQIQPLAKAVFAIAQPKPK